MSDERAEMTLECRLPAGMRWVTIPRYEQVLTYVPPKASDLDQFVGIPYEVDSFDCADLVALVQREFFLRDVVMPGRRPRGAQGAAQLGELSAAYARRREGPPEDGDLVLMFDHGQRNPGHAGVFFRLAHEGWVLHSNEQNGCSVLHRVRDLVGFGLRIEGYYEWV